MRCMVRSAEARATLVRPVPAIVQVEPLTTARALRGPFDYLRPDGADVGSVLVVPFGRRDVLGVVTGLADASEHDAVAPRRVLPPHLPPPPLEPAPWPAPAPRPTPPPASRRGSSSSRCGSPTTRARRPRGRSRCCCRRAARARRRPCGRRPPPRRTPSRRPG